MQEAVKEGYGGEGGLWGGSPFYEKIMEEVSLGVHRGELGSIVGLDQYKHRFAGGFGHGGQDIHMVSWS